MTWNPVRFVETLVHFRVAGPLRSVLESLPFFSQALTAPILDTVLTPTPLPKTVLTPDLDVATHDRLVTAVTALGYRVEAGIEPARDGRQVLAFADSGTLVNVPVVVWSPAGDQGDARASLAALVSLLQQATPITEATLADLRHPTPALKELWGALDDVVMGGVSASQVQWQEGLRFTGTVSTANSGGFASIRTRNVDPPINLAQWQGTVLHLKGDGQRYKWILRDSPGWDSLAYSRSFDTTAAVPMTVRTPFRDMVATFRARTKPDAAPFNPAHLCSMQLMLSKFEYDGALNPAFQAGQFQLDVDRIGVYREANQPLVLLAGGTNALGNEAQLLLGEANLVGIVPQAHGFDVVGSVDQLPGWISQETVSRLCQAFAASDPG